MTTTIDQAKGKIRALDKTEDVFLLTLPGTPISALVKKKKHSDKLDYTLISAEDLQDNWAAVLKELDIVLKEHGTPKLLVKEGAEEFSAFLIMDNPNDNVLIFNAIDCIKERSIFIALTGSDLEIEQLKVLYNLIKPL